MPRRKPREEKPEATVSPTVEKPIEVPQEVKPEVQPTATPQPAQPTTPSTTGGFTIKEATWEEFEKFTPTPRREKSKSPIREAYEAAKSGKVIRIEGLAPAQVRAVLAAVSQWNYREKLVSDREPVRVKYDIKTGVVYLAPAEKLETEKKQ
jgi:hypothetical protein